VPERIKNYAQQLQSGRKLNPDQRADLLNTARQNVLALAPQVNQTVNLYRNLVTSLKEDPDKIIRNPFEDILVAAPGSGQPPSAAAPSATPNRRRWNPQTGEFEYGR
jgi:hypothetical protein